MTDTGPAVELEPSDQIALVRAVHDLDKTSLAARLADYAGQPINRLMRLLPTVADRALKATVAAALERCLQAAIGSLGKEPDRAASGIVSTVITGVTGGVSGLFGIGALAVELPVTTTVMLRAIADIARREGEDLTRIESRLACLEVFALGSGTPAGIEEIGYFATRTVLARVTGNATAFLLERSVVDASAPAISRFISEVAARFGIVVSERAAASAVPILGAVAGATINVVFMEHFQRIARGHFTVRRLERRYGAPLVRARYAALARG